MKTLSALICAKNEEDFIGLCLKHLEPYVDEIIIVDNGSTDRTKEMIHNSLVFFSHYLNSNKVKIFDYPETNNMAEVRNFSLSKATGDWIIQCDADEIYTAGEMKKIRDFIETVDENGYISARVHYKNLAWRSGYAQTDFGHYPDRLYRRDVVERYRGVLPVDMTYVKREFLLAPNKSKGDIGPLEYDNNEDRSFIHPKQPILDVIYFHLARTRGYHFEYQKQMNYQHNIHPDWDDEQCRESVLINHWVTGRYDIEPVDVPPNVPTKTITNPKVSIIITNFEYENYVGEAIESAKNQTHPAYEIIVVDDCSYDASRQVIDKYGGIRRIYRKENGGPAAARNEGIAASTGDYFLLLDADDRLKPDAVALLLKEAIKTNAEVVYPDMEVFGGREDIRQGIWEMPDYTPEGMLQAQLVPSVCALIDRHAFDCAGGFDITTYFEDWFFFLTLSHRLKLNFKHIPIPLLEYRTHPKCRSDIGNPNRDKAMQYFKQHFPMNV